MIRKFLIEEIYPDEPLNRVMNLTSEPYELEFHLSLVAPGLSYVGFDNGELIGIALCGIKYLDEADKYKKEAEKIKGTKWGKFLELFSRLEQEANVLRRFGVDRSFHCYLYGIKRSYRGEGLTSQQVFAQARLIQENVDFVKSLGLKLATGDTTNFRTSKLADAFGGILCYEFPYKDFVDENGKPYIDPNSKHKFVRKYAYWIDNWGKSQL